MPRPSTRALVLLVALPAAACRHESAHAAGRAPTAVAAPAAIAAAPACKIERTFFSTGGLESERTECNGRLQGTYRMWHQNGALFLRTRYVANRLHGEGTKWYPNGRQMAHGAFVDGMKDGPWTFWDAEGRVVKRGRYDRGRRAGVWLDRTAEAAHAQP
jgi:hypothetical protein